MLIRRYLYSLQDASESLWYRLHNLAFEDGKLVMKKGYFETSTLYALGRVLAIERILALDGVYPQLDDVYEELGSELRTKRVDLSLHGMGFNQYDRVSLAEAVLEREQDQFRTSTYLEFRRRYEAEDGAERAWLEPARDAIQSLDEARMKTLLDLLYSIAERVSVETGITTTVKKKVAGSRDGS